MAKNPKKIFKSVDVISRELDVVDNFVLKYWKKYVYVAIAVVIVVALALVIIRALEHNTVSSSQELITAVSAEDLQSAIKNNPNNVLTPYCSLELVSELVDSKDMSGAKAICGTLIASSQDSYVVSRARMDLGYIAESQGNNDEALKIFAQISSDSASPEAFRSEALYNSGRIYLGMGKKDLAMDSLKKSSDIFSDFCVGWPEFSKNMMNRIN